MNIIEKLGSVFRVNTTTAGIQFTPSVSPLLNGGFVVVWNFVGSSIVGQLYDQQAFRVGGEFVVSTTNNNEQFAPDSATLSDGSFVVTWGHEFSSSDLDIRARRFSEAGVGFGTDFGIALSVLDETSPSITAQSGGRYLITWSREDNLVNFLQLNSAGNILSGPGVIDAAPPGAPEGRSSVAGLVDPGTYVVAFEQGDSIFQRRLVAGVNAERVDNPGFGVSDRPSIAALEGGGYVIVFRQGGSAGDSARPYVSGQIYDFLGNKVGGGFNPIVIPSAVDQTTPIVKGLVGGGFIVVWDDANFGLRALAYDKRGFTVQNPDGTAIIQLTPQGSGGSFGNVDVTQKKNGDIVVVWSGDDGNSAGINAQLLRVYNSIYGTNGDDRLATQLTGAVSNLVPGFQANDSISGRDGNDVIEGLGGASDVLDGGNGTDTATYIDALSPVTASLLVPAFNNGDALGDTYISIENLEGSFFNDQLIGNNSVNQIDGVDGNDILEGLGGNDTLLGNFGDDNLNGGDGNDSLNGGPGRDRLTGGGGVDNYTVDNAGDVIVEQQNQGTDSVRSPVSYSLGGNLEKLILTGTGVINGTGNSLNNTLTGNNSKNILKGGVGNDTLTGGGGKDFYDFSAPNERNDTLTDFNPIDDTIRVNNAGFGGGLRDGTLPASQFVLGTTAADRSDRFIYNRTNGALSYDADGTGSNAKLQISVLTNKPLLSFNDIVVI